MKKIIATMAFVIGIYSPPTWASDIVLNSSSVINRVLVASENVDLDLNANRIDALSVQVVYSSANPGAVSFTTGNTSTMSITVNDLLALTTGFATNRITVASNTALTGGYLQISAGGINALLREGRDWSVGASSYTTAVSLMTRMNGLFSGIFSATVPVNTAVLTLTAANAGTAANSYTIFSSSAAGLLVLNPTFTGGRDSAVITVGNVRLTANVDFSVGTSTANAVIALKNALRASGAGANINFSTTTNTSVVTGTATVYGAWGNVPLLSSTPTAISVSGPVAARGADGDVVYSAFPLTNYGLFGATVYQPYNNPAALSSVQKTTTRWGAGMGVLLATVSGTPPTGLTAQTTYYVSNLTATGFQLSDTSTGAIAGLALTLTPQSNTGGGSFTLTPLTLSGTPTFKLQASNDGTNFTDVYLSTSPILAPFQLTQSFASPYTAGSVQWDLRFVYFKILRFVYTAATQGGVTINYIVNGRNF